MADAAYGVSFHVSAVGAALYAAGKPEVDRVWGRIRRGAICSGVLPGRRSRGRFLFLSFAAARSRSVDGRPVAASIQNSDRMQGEISEEVSVFFSTLDNP